ncbi:MAG: hypothetical protein AABZ31_13935, partial [Bdellovibrionota bacterium]
MAMKQMILIPLLLTSSLAFTACSRSKSKKEPTRAHYTVLGDPIEIIRGAKTSAGFTAGTFKNGEELYLLAAIEFEEEGQYSDARVDLEEQNKTSNRSSSGKKAHAEDFLFTVNIKSDSSIAFENANEGFEFSRQEDQIIVTQPKDASSENRLLHTSISADKNTISFLIYSKNKQTLKHTLSAIYFARDPHTNLDKSGGNYEYVRGTGIKLSWPKKSTVDISVCNSDSSILNTYAKDSVEAWQ